jgi:hypothetical protein
MGGENLTYQRKVVHGTQEVKNDTQKQKKKSNKTPKQRKRGEITQRKQTMHQCRN